MKKRNRSPDRKTQKERIKEITEQLEAGVAAVFESDAYKAYLNCMSKFHKPEAKNRKRGNAGDFEHIDGTPRRA